MANAPFNFAPIDLSATPAAVLVHIGYCKINAIYAFNHGTGAVYIAIFDLGRLPVLGVDKPTWQFGVSGGSSANQGAPPASATFVAGLKCVNGFAYALVTAQNGGTLIGAGVVDGSIDWEIRP